MRADAVSVSGTLSVMDAELVDWSRQVEAAELGRRLRRARQLAGMTQADLGAPDVTGPYVSRIEDGQRRPSPALLEQLLHRLGITPREFIDDGAYARPDLALQVEIDHAELALVSGDAQEARRLLAALEERLAADTTSTSVRRHANRVSAGAMEAGGDYLKAIKLLETLCRSPEPEATWIRDLTALSRCHRESGDLDRAIAVGEDAAQHIERLGLGSSTEAVQLTLTVAAAYTLRGELDHAMQICADTIDADPAERSPMARASAYWNASLIETRRGAHDAALHLAQKALVHFELGEDSRNLGRLRTLVAQLQLKTDPPDPRGALRTLDRAKRELSWSAASTHDQARRLLTLAQARFALGDNSGALEALQECAALAPTEAPIAHASANALAGQIEAATGNIDAARAHFQRAVHILTGMGADREAAELWFKLGGLLSEVGETELALDAYRRAGASAGLSSSPARSSAWSF